MITCAWKNVHQNSLELIENAKNAAMFAITVIQQVLLVLHVQPTPTCITVSVLNFVQKELHQLMVNAKHAAQTVQHVQLRHQHAHHAQMVSA